MLRPVAQLPHNLLRWYDKVHQDRDMPWRQTRDPYAIWLSETMLQQTQVETVKPYFARFLARFPTVDALAQAHLDEVLTLWAGLGYYRRARHLHAAARQMVDRHQGRVPDSVDALLELPGIGRYTAGAVASIAFGLPAPVVDGNVMRVIARLTAFDGDIAEPRHAPFFWAKAAEIVAAAGAQANGAHLRSPGKKEAHAAPARYGDVNQALMELGATVCVPPPAKPACLVCPVRAFCRACSEGRQLELPIKRKKEAVPEIRGTALVITRPSASGSAEKSREVLLMKRPADGVWGGMWEFPVMALPPGEHAAEEAKNALRSAAEAFLHLKLGEVRSPGRIAHTLTHRRMVYEVLCAELSRGRSTLPSLPLCREGGRYVEARWVPWPPANRSLAIARVVEKIAGLAL